MSTELDQMARGIEALRLIARGWSAAQVARALEVSDTTVDRRLRKLYGILGARNAAHAVAIAGMQRLLSAEDLRAALGDRRVGWKPEEEA